MSRTWTIAVFAVLAGCSSKASGSPEGTCSASGSLWSCEADDAGVSQDGGATFFLLQCPPGVGSGGACADGDQTVDTGNPQQPAHISHGDCLQCASNGLGTFWSCPSGRWQEEGVYSCR